MDELFEALVLIQTRKLRHFPLILYDSRYWAGLITWIREMMLTSDKIQPEDAGLLLLSDDPQEMCSIVMAAHQANYRQEYAHTMNHREWLLR
jgi:predicted Rossmann-fold nucleotide-binding protein